MWGKDTTPLLNLLDDGIKFDLIIMADLVFNHPEHANMLETSKQAISDDGIVRLFLSFFLSFSLFFLSFFLSSLSLFSLSYLCLLPLSFLSLLFSYWLTCTLFPIFLFCLFTS